MESKFVVKVFTTTVLQQPNGQMVPETIVMEVEDYPKSDPSTNGWLGIVGRMVNNDGIDAKILTIYFSPATTKYVVVESKGSADIIVPRIQLHS